MNIYKKIKIKYFVFSALSLVFGLIIYIFFRENTYIHRLVPKEAENTISLMRIAFEESLLIMFIKYYFVDFLWCFSLSMLLLVVVDFRKKKTVILIAEVSALWGILFEVAQLLNITSGTFDFLDISMYILAAVLTVMINKFNLKRMDSK